jgi:Iron-containing redox enzyme
MGSSVLPSHFSLKWMENQSKLTESLDLTIDSLGYEEAEKQFLQLLRVEKLDSLVEKQPERVQAFEKALVSALEEAYEKETIEADNAHLFLQRILYYINRLNLFWYDDLQHYENERSFYLQSVRNQIEEAWQSWEIKNFDLQHYQQLDVQKALRERYQADLDPPLTDTKRYLQQEMSFEGYRYLLAIASLDGLVEASRMSRILGGASNEVQATLIRVLMEEYGNGRLNRKHSTFFSQMMAEVGLQTRPESYFDLAPWQLLASINHNFLLTERKCYFLRYNGGLTYFEIAGPSIYRDYVLAAERLCLSAEALGYWELHIREDKRHGQWMLDEVALPLVDMYPQDDWQLVLGYDQEKWMGDRAGAAIVKAIKQAEVSELSL